VLFNRHCAQAGKAIARLVPVEPQTPKRKAGKDRGKVKIADDFDAPLPDDLQGFFSDRYRY
jgi:antitoxin (DNA-binding transcriptional repressor) of toxin-antitoxin stability system